MIIRMRCPRCGGPATATVALVTCAGPCDNAAASVTQDREPYGVSNMRGILSSFLLVAPLWLGLGVLIWWLT